MVRAPVSLLPDHLVGLPRLRALVTRRHWTDVAVYARQLLSESTTVGTPYHSLYQALLRQRTTSSLKSPGGAGDSSETGPISAFTLALDSHKDEFMEILSLLCHALQYQRKFTDLAHEADGWSLSFGDLHKLSSGTKNAVAPTGIPWGLYILAATVSSGGPVTRPLIQRAGPAAADVTAQDLLWQLRATVAPTNYRVKWHIDHILANSWIAAQDWRQALLALDRMLDSLSSSASSLPEDATAISHSIRTTVSQCFLLSRQGRILLQAGALDEARRIFQRAENAWQQQEPFLLQQQQQTQQQGGSTPLMTLSKSFTDSSGGGAALLIGLLSERCQKAMAMVPVQLAMNRGLLSFAEERYEQASQDFHQAIQHYKKGTEQTSGSTGQQSCSTEYRRSDWISGPLLTVDKSSGVDEEEEDEGFFSSEESSHWVPPLPPTTEGGAALYVECVNNLALTAVYTCRLQDAVTVLENLVRDDPAVFLTNRVVSNLCTLYELGGDAAVASRQKKVLQCVASRYGLLQGASDLAPDNFRLTTP
jgi:tetratricopeptide (TPR) repeat protein